jgi:hypothetical protein
MPLPKGEYTTPHTDTKGEAPLMCIIESYVDGVDVARSALVWREKGGEGEREELQLVMKEMERLIVRLIKFWWWARLKGY